MNDELEAIHEPPVHGPFVIDCPMCDGVGCEHCEYVGVIESDQYAN